MKKIGIILGMLSASAIYAADKDDYVAVNLDRDDSSGKITLTCEPRLNMENMPKNWVKLCNEKGHTLLIKAKEDGYFVSVSEEPFGMAGEFAQQLSQELPGDVVPSSITSADLSIQ